MSITPLDGGGGMGALRPSGSVPTELVARLEAASVGSRELDAEIWQAATGEVVSWPWGQPDADGPWCVYGNAMWTPLAAYTTSLDAALALAERLGLTRKWNLWQGSRSGYVAQFEGDEYSHAPTPALAFCAAVVRATASRDTAALGTPEGVNQNTSEQST